jgi:ferric-dicitrate binding protein FerR (iron transport regulator)
LLAASILSAGTLSRCLAASAALAFGGTLAVRGIVKVNGQRATEGQTLFTNASVSTEANSESLITLANQSRLSLSASSELTIESSETRLVGLLETGEVLLDIPAGIVLDFSTADVAISNQSSEETVLQIESTACNGTRLTVLRGQIAVRHQGRIDVVNARETLSTTSGTEIPQTTQNSSQGKSKLGIFFAIGGAVAIVLSAALSDHNEGEQTPGDFGGAVINPSPR